jgi:hypothetical protein
MGKIKGMNENIEYTKKKGDKNDDWFEKEGII